METNKPCTSCKIKKPISEFYKKTKTGHMAKCKTCYNLTVKKYRNEATTVSRRRLQQAVKRKADKKNDPLKVKISNLRQSMRTRAKAYGLDQQLVPSTQQLRLWIEELPWVCHYTNASITLANLSIDHKIPLNRGGSNDLSNLCLATKQINAAKGTMTDIEFIELYSVISRWEDGGASILIRLRQGIYGKR